MKVVSLFTGIGGIDLGLKQVCNALPSLLSGHSDRGIMTCTPMSHTL